MSGSRPSEQEGTRESRWAIEGPGSRPPRHLPALGVRLSRSRQVSGPAPGGGEKLRSTFDFRSTIVPALPVPLLFPFLFRGTCKQPGGVGAPVAVQGAGT